MLCCVAPFALAIVAAAIKRYPYGGVAHGSPARVMQYLRAPASVCWQASAPRGCWASSADIAWRMWTLRSGLFGLAAVGILPLVAEARHPFRSIHAERAREFARRFWPDFIRGVEPVCLRWDLGIGAWDSTNLNVAVYLCNQMIYDPHRRRQLEPQWQAVSAQRPLRCVLSLEDPAERNVALWLAAMTEKYRLRTSRQIVVDMAAPDASPRNEHYFVYEFVPFEISDGGREIGRHHQPPPSQQGREAERDRIGPIGRISSHAGDRERRDREWRFPFLCPGSVFAGLGHGLGGFQVLHHLATATSSWRSRPARLSSGVFST